MVILEAKNVTKHFGSLLVVDHVNLKITKGNIHSIIGPNGAGKTTLFNLLTGFVSLTSGKVIYKGEDITNLPPYKIAKKGISRSFQITSIFPELTVHENIRIAAQSKEKSSFNFIKHFETLENSKKKADQVLDFIGLHEKRNTLAANLAYGEKRILDIGIAISTDPEILLLDEPMAGLPEGDLDKVMQLIKKISENLTVILIDHNIDQIIAISNVITVLNQGSIIAEGSPREIQDNQKVQDAYLGGLSTC